MCAYSVLRSYPFQFVGWVEHSVYALRVKPNNQNVSLCWASFDSAQLKVLTY